MARSSSLAADVPCVILAGGLATRMLPMTADRPKILLPVAGEPFAAHQLRWLASQGIRRVIIAIGHLGEQVEDFVGDGRSFGLEVAYSRDGDTPLGTGGALRRAVDLHGITGAVVVMYGDSYLDVDIDEVLGTFYRSNREALMVVYRDVEGLEVPNAAFDGVLVRYAKGSPSPVAAGLDHVDYGLSVIDSDVIRARIPPRTPADLAALQMELAHEHRLAGHLATERFYEIGSSRGLADLERHIATRGQSV
jgi:NDP-sugar pyrophosphorylase family protein